MKAVVILKCDEMNRMTKRNQREKSCLKTLGINYHFHCSLGRRSVAVRDMTFSSCGSSKFATLKNDESRWLNKLCVSRIPTSWLI